MNFNADQLAIIEDDSPYIQVIAGAGAGKTSTMIGILDRTIRKKDVDLERMLVVTFSRKAAQEFRERLEKIHPNNGIRIQTFHAYCLQTLREFHPEYSLLPPSILSEKEKEDFFRNFFRKHRFRVGGIPYKYLMEDPLGRFGLLEVDEDLAKIAQNELQNFKIQEKKLEFQDLVTRYLQALQEGADWTKVPKDRTRYVIVDEFQDTDEEQLQFLCSLAPDRLTVVGDDWQAIYGFRGATPKPFLELDQYFYPLRRHFLATNYRSLEDIVRYSQIPILKNQNYIAKEVRSHREGRGDWALRLYPEGRVGLKIACESITSYLQANPDTKILCRTNFRIAEFQICGIPEENLMTIHASKGLEFSSVFVDLLGGWNQDPLTIDESVAEEERRILYVAMSRAKDNLFLLGRLHPQPQKNLEDVFFSYFTRLKIPKWKYKVS